MTFLLFLFAVLLIGTGVRLLIHAAVLPRIRLSLHLRQIEGYGFDIAESDAQRTGRARLNRSIAMFAERVGRALMQQVPGLTPLRRGELSAAAYYEISPEALHGYRAIAAVAVPSLLGFLIVASGNLSMLTMLLIGGAAL